MVDYSKCPFCGSTKFGQCNKATNFLLSRGIATGFKLLTGLHGSASALEDEFDRVYQCDDCHRKWKSWENPNDIPRDELKYQQILGDIRNGKYKFETNEEVLRFFWEMDHQILTYHSLSPFIKSKVHLLRAFACLQYCVNIYEKVNDFLSVIEFDMACEAGMRECRYSDDIATTEENSLCFYLLQYFDTVTLNDISPKSRQEMLGRCIIPQDTSNFVFVKEYWVNVYNWIKKNAKKKLK